MSPSPLQWPGRRLLSAYGAQELMMISMLWNYVSEMTLPSAGYFYSRRAVWQKQLCRSVSAILPEQKQHVSPLPDFVFSKQALHFQAFPCICRITFKAQNKTRENQADLQVSASKDTHRPRQCWRWVWSVYNPPPCQTATLTIWN